jgi:transcriptional regulator with PAS, ATPase and Fis domain
MAYHILGIAPYEALANLMRTMAQTRPDIDLDVYVGNLDQGVEIAKSHAKAGYDAIISRGGTAREIRKITDLPVISIELSVYDVLRAIRLAENYQDSFAVVGFDNITRQAHLLCDLLQYNKIKIISISSRDEAASALTELMEQGISMVVCDIITQQTARALNMYSILITSGVESIMAALDRAVEICQSYHTIQEENRFLRHILQDQDSSTIVMSEDGQVFLTTWEGGEPDVVYDMLRKDIRDNIRNGGGKFFHNIENVLYSINARIASYKTKKYVVYYVTASKLPLTAGRYGLHFYNKEEVERDFYQSFYSLSGAMGETKTKLEEIAGSSYPVLLLSEEGTGKRQVANYIYMHSELASHPFVSIDCNTLNDRSWEYLINHYNSPFNDNDNTISMYHLERLSPERHKKLLAFMNDSSLARRNRLILSGSQVADPEIQSCLMDYMKELSCLYINLPALRQRLDELPMLANLYLSHLNLELGKQLIGFEPASIRIMQNFDWPNNYAQFNRLLRTAAAMTESSYVSADTIANLIANEKVVNVYQMINHQSASQALPQGVMPSMTLNDMMIRVVEQVLSENNGNQSKTARQLGISRTTLWRYLGREGK